MRISPPRLENAMEAKSASPLQLVEALVAPSFKSSDAMRALTNWLQGRDHPRCKAEHIRKMAQALSVRPADICKFTSENIGHRGSPRKAKLLTDLIKGKTYDQAVSLLTFTPKRAALNIKRCLNAAMTEAQINDADTTKLVVTESRVNAGPMLKRFQPKDRGRAHSIHKPFSHITISLEEKIK